jgi:hypothetical protein
MEKETDSLDKQKEKKKKKDFLLFSYFLTFAFPLVKPNIFLFGFFTFGALLVFVFE